MDFTHLRRSAKKDATSNERYVPLQYPLRARSHELTQSQARRRTILHTVIWTAQLPSEEIQGSRYLDNMFHGFPLHQPPLPTADHLQHLGAPVQKTLDSSKQPDTRPIFHDQLVAEVKGIYAGLVRVESKCIEVDNGHNSQNDRLPASLEHMLMFIYLAYLMMALLYEAVPAFEDTSDRVSRRPWAL